MKKRGLFHPNRWLGVNRGARLVAPWLKYLIVLDLQVSKIESGTKHILTWSLSLRCILIWKLRQSIVFWRRLINLVECRFSHCRLTTTWTWCASSMPILLTSQSQWRVGGVLDVRFSNLLDPCSHCWYSGLQQHRECGWFEERVCPSQQEVGSLSCYVSFLSWVSTFPFFKEGEEVGSLLCYVSFWSWVSTFPFFKEGDYGG